MTFWIVLFFVIAVIVGNLLWLRPNPRERALAAQREQAKAAGFSVHLRPAPEWLELPAGQRLIAHYQLMTTLPAARLGRWRWHAGLGNWQPVGNPEGWLSAPPWPTPAPPGWLGVHASPNGVVVYWREDGRRESVEHMREVLMGSGA